MPKNPYPEEDIDEATGQVFKNKEYEAWQAGYQARILEQALVDRRRKRIWIGRR